MTAVEKKFKLGYRPELDGLRGIAVLAVAFHNLENFPLAAGGHLGVDIFFVLSGFLITTLLIEEWDRTRGIDLLAFYTRRGLRLLPALYVLLAALLAVVVLNELFTLPFRDRIVQGTDRWLVGIASAFFYVSNWVGALRLSNLGPLSHTWSLASEEQFYLLWPPLLILLLSRRFSNIRVVYVLALVVFLVAIERALLYEPGSHWRARYGLDTRGDGLVLGCMIALLATAGVLDNLTRYARLLIKAAAVAGAAALIIIGMTVPDESKYLVYGLASVITLGSAAVLLFLISEPRGIFHAALSGRYIVWMGRVSYGFYLWHYPIMNAVRATGPAGWTVEIVLALVITALSYYLLERPILQWKNRRFRRVPEGAPG